MRTIHLTKIGRPIPFEADTDDVDENVRQLHPGDFPCSVNVEAIRCFYPRKENRPGTRLTFIDGGGFVVREAYADVEDRINEAVATS